MNAKYMVTKFHGQFDHLLSPHKAGFDPHNSYLSCFRFCNARCEKQESNFVCGSDGNLYRNQCEMKKAKCGQHIYQVSWDGSEHQVKVKWQIIVTIQVQSQKDLEWLYSAAPPPPTHWFKLKSDTLIQIKN